MMVAGTVHTALRASVGHQPRTPSSTVRPRVSQTATLVFLGTSFVPTPSVYLGPTLPWLQINPLPPPRISRSHSDHIKHVPLALGGLCLPGILRFHLPQKLLWFPQPLMSSGTTPFLPFNPALEGSCRPYFCISTQPPLRPSPYCISLVPSQWALPPWPFRSAASLPSASRPLHLQAPPLQVHLKSPDAPPLGLAWFTFRVFKVAGPQSSGAVHGM